MRLTLRTLLAYRDGVLSAADADDLHRRIQQSHDAGNLLRRIGAVTKLNHVAAPPVQGKGMGGDPNSIAEYLDDALAHTQVPELERICLVSDVQLAELADCHELLSSAMHTKVTVPRALREMALKIGDPAQREHLALALKARKAPRRANRRELHLLAEEGIASHNPAESHGVVDVQVQAPMVASGGGSIKPQGLDLETAVLAHEVPEYLVDSSQASWRIPLAIGGLLALLAVLVWQSLGPWDRISEMFAAVEPTPSRVAANLEYDIIVESETAPPGIESTETLAGEGTVSEEEEIAVDVLLDNQAPPGAEVAESVDAPPGLPAVVASPSVADSSNVQAPAGLEIESAEPPAPSSTAAGTSDAPPGLESLPQAARSRADGGPAGVWLPKDGLEEREVLLVSQGDKWLRVQAGQPLDSPSRLVVPPQTRTTIDLPGGVLWTACGPSLLELDVHASDKRPILRSSLCRGLVRGGPDGRQLSLVTPLGEHRIDLPAADSLASVEVAYRPEQHGSVLERTAVKPVLVITAAEGLVSIETLPADAQAEKPTTRQLTLGTGVAFIDGQKPREFRLQSIPSWFSRSVDRPIDGLAIEDVQSYLSRHVEGQMAIAPALAELTANRKPETAALAVQMSLMIGNWQPLAAGFLDNERMRSHWNRTLDLARQILAGNPVEAEQLLQALVAERPDDGSQLFELLIGLPAQQVTPDGLARLVRLLDSPQLTIRVLAAYQLQNLTGKHLGYQPHVPNRSSTQQWRRELATNRLGLLSLPDLIPERVPR